MNSFRYFLSVLADAGKAVVALLLIAIYNLLEASPFGVAPVALGANTLTNLIPTVVAGLDVVSREMVGFIPSVNRDPRTDRVGKNQTLYSWSAPAATLSNITPANVSPQAGDSAFGNVPVTITNFKMTDFYYTGEEAYALGGGFGPMMEDQVQQGLRAIVNQMESDIWTAGYVGGSRATGTAGTTPFATNLNSMADIKKILDDNGAPTSTRSLVGDTSMGAALRKNTQLTKSNEAGTDLTLRTGELLNLMNFSIKESAQISAPAAGTGINFVVNGATAKGATSVVLKTGTLTVLPGDIVTITSGGVAASYGVVTGTTGAGTIVINKPGLTKAAADGDTVAVVAAATRNLAFSKNALLLATRLPALPPGGDIAVDRAIITDPRSGISIELAMYLQYRQIRYEMSAAWSATVIKAEHIATLLG